MATRLSGCCSGMLDIELCEHASESCVQNQNRVTYLPVMMNALNVRFSKASDRKEEENGQPMDGSSSGCFGYEFAVKGDGMKMGLDVAFRAASDVMPLRMPCASRKTIMSSSLIFVLRKEPTWSSALLAFNIAISISRSPSPLEL